MERREHWDDVYAKRLSTQVSWYAPRLSRSVSLLERFSPPPGSVIDVGAGASTLVDELLGLGYGPVTALDISAAALAVSRGRLGERAASVRWIVGDIVGTDLPAAGFDAWHDRAAFHFLVDPADREAYSSRVAASLRPGGHAVIAAFAPDGPVKCSGLDVVRYDGEAIAAALGPAFRLKHAERETHVTPVGAEQRFVYAVLERVAS